ncbi:hypothetical protein BHM03_00024169 [Ensete ventricosum]|nr:hypothetical protein BHM03_00024169 [Ensete ventricosum]
MTSTVYVDKMVAAYRDPIMCKYLRSYAHLLVAGDRISFYPLKVRKQQQECFPHLVKIYPRDLSVMWVQNGPSFFLLTRTSTDTGRKRGVEKEFLESRYVARIASTEGRNRRRRSDRRR